MELPPRVWDTGPYKGLPMYEEKISGLAIGQRTTLKSTVVFWNSEGHKMRSSLYQQHFILNAELPKEAIVCR